MNSRNSHGKDSDEERESAEFQLPLLGRYLHAPTSRLLGADPPADLHGAPDYRRHPARVLTGQALAGAAGI